MGTVAGMCASGTGKQGRCGIRSWPVEREEAQSLVWLGTGRRVVRLLRADWMGLSGIGIRRGFTVANGAILHEKIPGSSSQRILLMSAGCLCGVF